MKRLFMLRWLRNLVIAAATFLPVTAFAQAPAPAHAWGCFPEASLSDDIYWAAQPPAIRALRNLPSGAERDVKALDLAKAGYTIDVPIHAWNWDAVCTMGVRKQTGYTWVPSALQEPVILAPGLSFPGLTPYDASNPPKGSIKVSVDAKDYPPYDPPKPVATTSSKGPIVGLCWPSGGRTVCSVGSGGYGVKEGDSVVQDGKTYTAHVTATLMGTTIWFELK